MLRNLVILPGLLTLTLPMQAQFDNLVTTDDGSTLLFQSQWRLTGSAGGNLSKIFRWDSHGFATVFSPPDPGLITAPSAYNPLISGDGSIAGYISYAGCAGITCNTTPYSLVLSGASLPSSMPPSAIFQLSRNGRYLAAGTSVLDRTTGVVQTAGSGDPSGAVPLPVGGRFGIANTGDILLLVLHRAFIVSTVDLVLSGKSALKIVNAPIVYVAVVSAAENRVVYEIPSVKGQTDRELWSFDVGSGQATLLEDFDFGTYLGVSQYQPAVSNDGMRLLYRRMNPATRAWEAVVHDYSAGTSTVLGTMLPSSNNFTISGDGRSVWLHRTDGRLVRIAVDTLAATETPGRHAWMAQREGAAVFGSYNHLFGGGFTGAGGSGPSADLSVDLAGLACPVLNATTQQLDIEIPWEAYPGNFTLTLRNSSSPFESLQAIDTLGIAPTFERSGLPYDAVRPEIVVHQDFHGLVTFSDPALPGEVVHFYMTGLGDVQPRPQTGQASSSAAVASQRPQCSLTSPFAPAPTPAAVLFAGIAPGTIGIYQVDVSLPAPYPSSLATITCFDLGTSPGISGDFGTFYISTSTQKHKSHPPPQ